MNKQEFLNALRSQLKGLPKDELENRISFYEEMINDRMDEGLSEEAAVADIGGEDVDAVVTQEAKNTSLYTLVKEKTKPSRPLRGWEIALIIIGFPFWFPLILTAMILCFVAYILVWTLVIVTYSVEAAFIAYAGCGLLGVLYSFSQGGSDYMINMLGASRAALGLAFLFIFACIGATKLTFRLSRNIILGIKRAFIRKGK